MEADATRHPNSTDGAPSNASVLPVMGHDSLSELGTRAEPWKGLEGKKA